MTFRVETAAIAGATSATPPGSTSAMLDAQLRFRIDGLGPMASRRVTPVTSAARELVRTSPAVVESVRSLLAVVDRAADPGTRSSVAINGVAFSDDLTGHGLNIFAAHADSDAQWQRSFERAGPDAPEVAAQLLEESNQSAADSLALVTSGWINLGPAASGALLGARGIGSLPMPSVEDAALAVRVIRHEAEHIADTSMPSWMSANSVRALRESLAEANSSSPAELAATRDVLGLGALVPDAALPAAISVRPYPQYEQALAALLEQAGLDPSTPQVQQLVAGPAVKVAGSIVAALQRNGSSGGDAKQSVERAFSDG